MTFCTYFSFHEYFIMSKKKDQLDFIKVLGFCSSLKYVRQYKFCASYLVKWYLGYKRNKSKKSDPSPSVPLRDRGSPNSELDEDIWAFLWHTGCGPFEHSASHISPAMHGKPEPINDSVL